MAMAGSRINVVKHCRVSPPPGTVAEKILPLTFFDLVWLIHPPISRVLFYDFPCSTSYFTTTLVPNLKNSLSLALKHFFPLAGNLTTPSNISITNPQIRYLDGDSVSLTFAECTGNDFNHVSGNHGRDAEELTPFVPELPSGGSENNTSPASGGLVLVSPLLAVQVTLFPNQGIAVGFTNSHAVADGSSMINFVRAWASFALQLLGNGSSSSRDDNRDDAPLLLIHQLPFYDRSVIKDPKGLATLFRSQLAEIENDKSSQPENAPPTPTPTPNKVRATFIMRRSDIQKLKNLVSAQRPKLAHVSSFTVVCAYLWTSIAKARVVEDHVADDQSEIFGFPMDCRARLDPPVPAAYFGNCLTGWFTSEKSSQLVKQEGFVIAAELIGEGIHTLIHNEEEGGLFKNLELFIPLMLDVQKKLIRSLGVAGSPKLDYYNTVDFGWGKPKKFEFVLEPLSLSRCKDSEGDLEIGLCLPKNEMEAFSVIFAQGIEGLCKNILVN